ncbi:UDP-glucose 4-epimerase [Afipia sp. Root123D2]|uniref:NAD-dependent epimerase/dehydratase family protein n=1 Tax=Afipia sp. Root123D2 TaxID=1736436 RepID=UPI0006FC8EEE|nr:NAD(P)-dependent oxidoreductase [Afipia sp. Root123D2]KQW18422.1 UDP-glucose 4-epimerase [Afipia sp. Root123D2]
MRKVLLTGASGGIGTRLRKLLRPLYPELILSDLMIPADLLPGETFVPADLADFGAVRRAVEGVEGIIHLGGHSVEGPWDTILNANIIGTYHLFEAAHQAGVKRAVFASSNHAVGFYPRAETIGVNEMVRPDSRYGVSKAFGEALAAFYAFKHGIGSFCIRIGNMDDRPVDQRRLSIWLSPDDLVALIRIGLEMPGLVHEIVYGMSDNERAWWNNERAHELGYRPRDRAEDHAAEALAAQAKLPPDPVGDIFQGGAFCSAEFSGLLEQIKKA